MSLPRMSLHIGDYRKDTGHLRAAGHGAYLLLIMHYWTKGGLPDDDRQLASIACLTDREWKQWRPILSAFFGEGWKHKRIDLELKEAQEKYEKRVAAGKKGGEAKATAYQCSSNATANDVAMPYQPITLTEKEVEKKSSRSIAKAMRPPECPFFEEFWQHVPSRGKDGPNPKEPARKAFAAALKRGTPPEKIIEAMKARRGIDPAAIGTRFIPRASTWLNEQSYNDDPPPSEQPISDVPGLVYVKQESPEWTPFARRYRAEKGMEPPTDKNGGWGFPAEWASDWRTEQVAA